MATTGGRFDFDDGGTYCGGWQDGKAHGVGVCTGPKGQGEFAGTFQCGFEVSGIYKWSTGSSYKGQWTQGKRHGQGVENKGRWLYQGEWTQGFKGRYGIRMSLSTGAKYEGTWTTGLQDGYGVETYADGGTYKGQWLRGIRHGYGVRQSIPYGLATLCRQKAGRESLTSLRSEPEEDHVVKERDRKMAELRSGFVLTAARATSETRKSAFQSRFGFLRGHKTGHQKRSSSAEANHAASKSSIRRAFDGLKLRKQKSEEISPDGYEGSPSERRTGGRGWRSKRLNDDNQTLKSNISGGSYASSRQSPLSAAASESCASFAQDESIDLNAVETYSGEWKNDKRSGFGISKRTDGLMYEGEWENNKRHGYGVTTFKDGSREEGKYKNDAIVISDRNSKLLALRLKKLREHVANAMSEAQRAAQQANSKSEMAVSRMVSARAKAELAMQSAARAHGDAEKAKLKALEYAPEFMEEITKRESTPVTLLGMAGAPKKPVDAGIARAQEAASSFVSQFTDHYNADHHYSQVQSAKEFLNKAKEPSLSTNHPEAPPASSSQHHPSKVALPTIGGMLLTAGLDTSLVKPIVTKLSSPEETDRAVLEKNRNFDRTLDNQSSLQHQLTSEYSLSQGNKSNLKSPSKCNDEVMVETLDNVSVLNAMTQKKRFQFKNKFGRSKHQSQHNLQQQSQNSNINSTSNINSNINNTAAPNDNLLSPLIESDAPATEESVLPSLLDHHFDQYLSPHTQPLPPPPQNYHLNHNFPPHLFQGFDFQMNMPPSINNINSNNINNINNNINTDYIFNLAHPMQQHYSLFSYDNPRSLVTQVPNDGTVDEYHQYVINDFDNTDPSMPPYTFERRQTLPSGKLTDLKTTATIATTATKTTPPTTTATTSFTKATATNNKNQFSSIPKKSSKSFVGSMPNVAKRSPTIVGYAGGHVAKEAPAMAREEVHFMSMMRREELRHLREAHDRNRNYDLVIGINEFTNWCQQSQLLVFLVALNLALAAMFYNLLSR